MARVVITGSTRGLGFALANSFLETGDDVTISGRNRKHLDEAMFRLSKYGEHVHSTVCDVKEWGDLFRLWSDASEKWGQIDIWINNAGINQPYENLWDIAPEAVENIFKTNLMATIYASQIVMQEMIKQGFGAIYNVEGFGSNGMQRKGLNLYGTTKRALTYFTDALAKEARNTQVRIGILSPGMMVTDFLKDGEGNILAREETVKIFNILGDKPETVAKFLVERIKQNPPNGSHIEWLTNTKAAMRFAKSRFIKRNLFEDSKS